MSEDRLNTPTAPVGEAPTVVAKPHTEMRSEARTSQSVFDPPDDRFEEAAELGRGGMGRVVEAHDRTLDRAVAIKQLHAIGDTELARFEREVRITARLEHPSIVPILDAGRDERGRPYYVMRKIEGVPLSVRVTESRTPRERLALVPSLLGVIDAAAYAHARGIVHRDIKPWNILLGAFGETLLIDWGIARELGGALAAEPSLAPLDHGDVGLTRAGDAYGTPGFMAPEQARGEPVDRRADVYSLGATLYYVLAGGLPLGDDPTRAIARAAAGESPDFTVIPPEVPIELVAITRQALATDPAERYRDAGELAADVRRFLAGQLVAAHDYTPLQRLARWVRKHRVIATTLVAATLVIAVGSWLSVTRILDERDRASRARLLAERRAEDLLLQRARSLVASDPTSAVALLATLPPTSQQWPAVRAIARGAVFGGVERSLGHHRHRVSAVAISPAGRIASSGEDLKVHDQSAARIVAQLTCRELAWLDEQTLGCIEDGGLAVIDVDTGTPARIAGKPAELLASGGRLYVRDAGTVTAYDRDAAPTPVATNALAIAAANGRVAIAGRDFLRVLDAGGTRERSIAMSGAIFRLALSHDGTRVAAFTQDAMLEWNVGDHAPPRTWPRSNTHGHDVAYAGNTLLKVANDGTGVSELGTVERSRWAVRGELLQIHAVAGGVLAATSAGKLALLDEVGVIEIAHRPLDLVEIALAADLSFAVLGTLAGDVIELDLRASRPRTFPLEPRTRLFAVSSTHVVLGESLPGHETPTRVVTIEIATGARRELGILGFGTTASIAGGLVTATGGLVGRRELVVWDLQGRELVRVPSTGSQATGRDSAGRTSVFYEVPSTGEIFEQPLSPFGPVRAITTLPRHTTPGGRAVTTIMGMFATNAGLVVTSAKPSAEGELRYAYTLHDEAGTHELALDPTVSFVLYGRTRDGTWWLVENYQRLWRWPRGSTPRPVELPTSIKYIFLHDDRVDAFANDRLLEIGLDGTLLRQITMEYEARRRWTADGFATIEPGGIAVATLVGALRYTIPTFTQPQEYAAEFDGATVAAVIGSTLAVWRDPVPGLEAFPQHLRAITDAELALGSDVLTWRR